MKDETATDGQIFAATKLIGNLTKTRDERLYVASKLIDRDIQSFKELSKSEWRMLRDSAYDNWVGNVWEVSDKFKSKVNALRHKYEVEVVGQTLLF